VPSSSPRRTTFVIMAFALSGPVIMAFAACFDGDHGALRLSTP
jgi:hypothetical protein